MAELRGEDPEAAERKHDLDGKSSARRRCHRTVIAAGPAPPLVNQDP